MGATAGGSAQLVESLGELLWAEKQEGVVATAPAARDGSRASRTGIAKVQRGSHLVERIPADKNWIDASGGTASPIPGTGCYDAVSPEPDTSVIGVGASPAQNNRREKGKEGLNYGEKVESVA